MGGNTKMDLNEADFGVWIGFIWLRIWADNGLL
jgi:hypothetical protein